MTLTGHQLLGSRESGASSETFIARNLALGTDLEPVFHEASEAEIDEDADPVGDGARDRAPLLPGLLPTGEAREDGPRPRRRALRVVGK